MKDVRLPGNLVPRVYNISLMPVLDPGNFTNRFLHSNWDGFDEILIADELRWKR